MNWRTMISGTAWTTTSGTKRWMSSSYPPLPRLYHNSGLESRAHEPHLSFLCAWRNTGVHVYEGVGGSTLSDPESAEREDEVAGGCTQARQCGRESGRVVTVRRVPYAMFAIRRFETCSSHGNVAVPCDEAHLSLCVTVVAKN